MIDIYVHTSKLEIRKHLAENDLFVRPSEYSENLYNKLYNKLHRSEYGYFKLNNIRLHVLLGKILEENCPWCDCPPDFFCIKLNIPTVNQYQCQMVCPNCKSRGPEKILSINDESLKEYVEDQMRFEYSEKLNWDRNLTQWR